jgi:hypothetical protein
MTRPPPQIDIGPFAETRAKIDNFCHNLFLSQAMDRCVIEMARAQEEYEEAQLRGDEELMEEKQLQVQAYQSSLQLTAYLFECVSDAST